jgi:hypothetical protein
MSCQDGIDHFDVGTSIVGGTSRQFKLCETTLPRKEGDMTIANCLNGCPEALHFGSHPLRGAGLSHSLGNVQLRRHF